MVASPNTMAPLLLRNLISSLFLFVDESLINLSERYKVLDIVRCLVVSSFLFFLRLLLSVVSSLKPMKFSEKFPPEHEHKKSDYRLQLTGGVGDSGIARALSQLLAIVNTVPVSSRKYDVVRSLAERLIDENLQQGFEALHEVNRTVLSAAFAKTLVQLEAAMMDQERARGGGCGFSSGPAGSGAKTAEYYNLNRVLRMVKSFSDMAWSRAAKPREESGPEGGSAEKLAAELVWLAQKLTFCGFAKEAVCRWASASNLAWLAVSAEPRLQGLLVNISAFLFKQAKDMRLDQADESGEEQQRRMKLKMLMSWLPLLCRASNGTDAPILSLGERAELERVLEVTIEMLESEEEQEQVLAQWLHHFMYCPSSDWPNLHSSYTRWCTASRKLLLHLVNAD